ncbi:predicted protein [Nematostella vectensis]|uniref:Uncharacterized protein n=1 Tax=Nematostella vectensis TaxID=45351 RepID=A8DUZ1_NEMVE|nr:predicted protein [Nematostella vectensis]|eukprot:XP_001618997.1 hypothetical protein NEMVEDRAFT_v1g224617 [Nematostella vectensis]
MGWKSMFKDELLNNVTIKAQFNRALDLMNQAVASPGGYLQPGAKEHIAYLTSTERRYNPKNTSRTSQVQNDGTVDTILKNTSRTSQVQNDGTEDTILKNTSRTSQVQNDGIVDTILRNTSRTSQVQNDGTVDTILSTHRVPHKYRTMVETARAQASAQNIPSNFKDLIQKMAEENNIVFTPNRRQDGKMIYNLGKLSIYIERGVVYTLVQGTWSPVSVQELIMMAK